MSFLGSVGKGALSVGTLGLSNLAEKAIDSTNNKFQASATPIQAPVSTAQAQQAYGNTQDALSKQQAFLQALQGQNGIGNQQNVFNQLQGVANGTGPNPALAQLNQQTGNNIQNQAALMASQRGAGANAGLLARQAAQQGGAIQQNALGQAATMQANQQLGALNQLGGIAGQQVGQQANALQGYNQYGLQGQQNLLGGINAQNNANIGMQENLNNVNSGVANANAANHNALLGGVLNAAGGAAAKAIGGGVGAAHGGMLQNLQQGGPVPGQAKVKGDSYKNDTVHAVLSPKEIVIPRHITMAGKDAPELAKQFVAQELAKHAAQNKGKYAEGGDVGMPEDVDGPPAEAEAASPEPIPAYDYSQPMGAQILGRLKAHQPLFNMNPEAPQNVTITPDEAPQPEMTSPAAGGSPQVNNMQQNMQGTGEAGPQAAQNTDPYGFGQTYDTYGKGLANIESGIRGEAKTAGDLAKSNYDTDLKAKAASDKALSDYQTKAKTIDDQVNGKTEELANFKIDPNRYLSSLGSTQKVGNAIAMLLSGVGAGLSHSGTNMASDFIDSQINRDIDAQKQEMGKKENLLRINMEKYKNLNDATDMTRVMMNQAVMQELQMNAAKSGTDFAKYTAAQKIGDYQMKNAQIIGGMKARAAASASGQMPAELDPAQDRRVEIPIVTKDKNGQPITVNSVFHAPDKETADKIRPQIQSLDELNSVNKEIEDFNKKVGMTPGFFTANSGAADALNQRMDDAVAKVLSNGGQIGRLIGGRLKATQPVAGAILPSRGQPKTDAIRNMSNQAKLAIIRANLHSGMAFGK